MIEGTWTEGEKQLATRIAKYDNSWSTLTLVVAGGILAVATVATGGIILIPTACYALHVCAACGEAHDRRNHYRQMARTVLAIKALRRSAAPLNEDQFLQSFSVRDCRTILHFVPLA